MRPPVTLLAASLALAITTLPADAQQQGNPPIIATPSSLSWSPAPAVLPAGAKLAVIEGDPTKAGAYTMRLKVPDGYRIPPHWHPGDEHVTVLQGTFRVGLGTPFDNTKLTDLPTGSFGMLHPGMVHFAEARGETVIQLHGMGPWSLTYANPADDPRGGKASR
ncbi:MAG TPA: cupin domain-containing protein [Gemmatimonadales bacterium]